MGGNAIALWGDAIDSSGNGCRPRGETVLRTRGVGFVRVEVEDNKLAPAMATTAEATAMTTTASPIAAATTASRAALATGGAIRRTHGDTVGWMRCASGPANAFPALVRTVP